MAGKFINELSSNPPAPEDLVVFFDKSKAVTVQAPLSDVIGAGLNIAGATKGQTAVVDTKVDPISNEVIPFLKWEKAGIDFGSTTTRPSAGTDEILTHDPVSGTNGKTTVHQLLVAGGIPAVTGADAGKQLTVQAGGTMGWTSDTSDLPAFTVADKGKQLTVKEDGSATEWAETIPAATKTGQILKSIVGRFPNKEWADPELPTITAGLTALQTKADKSGVEWVASVNQATNLKGGFTSGAYFPVNDTKADTTRFVDAAAFRKLAGVPELLYFPNWAPTNEQVGAGWNDMGVALARMASIVSSDTLAGKGAVTTTAANSFPGGYGFSGAVVTPSGKVVCFQRTATSAKVYDIATGSVITLADVSPGKNDFLGGVLLKDGRVFFAPYNSPRARIYDPVSGAVTTPAPTFPGNGLDTGNYPLSGGVLLPNGKVFMVPHNATAAIIYDPATDSISTPAGTYPGGSAYSSGVLLPSGKVFCVPASATTARIYDPATDTLTTPAGTYPGSYAYSSGVLLPSGKVFMVPLSATSARIYDPVTDTLTTPAGTYPGNYAYSGGVLLPNGKVFCIPGNATTARIYDPVTDTLTTPPGTYPGAAAYSGGVLMPNGKVFCVPHAATAAAIVDFSSTQLPSIPANMVLSPFFNKF